MKELYISNNLTIKLSEYKVFEISGSQEKHYEIEPIYVSTIMKNVLSKLLNDENIFLPKYKDIYRQQHLIYKHFEEKGIKNYT